MMDRVARSRGGRFPYITIPRKGRIRILLALLAAGVLLRFVPSVIKNAELPSWSSFSRFFSSIHPVKKMQAHPRVSGKHTPLSAIPSQLSKYPASLSCVQTIPFSGRDSLVVYTSIDTSLKRHLEKMMANYNPLYGAIAVLDPVTGRILSLVSYTHDSMPDIGANLCLRSIFPAASTFKTITAAAAIELEQFSSGCMLEHRGRTSTLYSSQIKRDLDWTVGLSFSQAYARSVNAVFARIGIYEVGRDRLLDVADSFGFNTPLPGDLECEPSHAACTDSLFDIAEFSSGFNQRTTISPLHGALIAAAIAENGMMPVPSLVDSIVQQDGRARKYERTQEVWRQVVQQSTAGELQRLMQGVASIGTARKQFRDIRNSDRFNDFTYGGKTGSVDKDGIGRVDWFIGFAAHPQKKDERVAIGALTVHGAYWTVHSSYLAAEAMRFYLRSVQERKKKNSVEKLANAADTAQSSGQ